MTLPRQLGWPLGILRHRLIERPLWRWRYRHGVPRPADDEIRGLLPYGRETDWLSTFGAGHRARFGWGPEDRDAFLARYDAAGGDAASLVTHATQVAERSFDILGSGPHTLGQPIDWRQDFKSGHRFPDGPAWRIDYRDLGRNSDVKVPWDLARCHFALVLAQAYWVTGDERHAEVFRELVSEWLDSNPPGTGIHWACPMELAIRGINLAFAFGIFRGSAAIPEAFWARLLTSLVWHGRVIRANLEFGRRLGNHFIADCAGLVVLGHLLGDTSEGRRWARFGTHTLETQMRWQVHEDGVSYEKSISYHRLVVELFLISFVVAGRSGRGFSGAFGARLQAMLEFVRAYLREDGSTPLVADADDGRVLPWTPWVPVTDHRHILGLGGKVFARGDLCELAAGHQVDALWILGPHQFDLQATRRAPGSGAFRSGGYYVLRGAGCHTFMDAGPLGFEGDLVHGHLDCLSLEIATPGGTFVSDTGCYAYTADPAAYREQVRTRAHNTVTVDGQDQADLTGLWRVREDRTAPRLLAWTEEGDQTVWEAEHHGYTRLAEPVIHRRRVEFDRAAVRWRIVDTLSGRGRHRIEVNWHLAPGVLPRTDGGAGWELRRDGGSMHMAASAPLALAEGWVAPTYGRRVAAPVLRSVIEDSLPLSVVTTLAWAARASVPEGSVR